MRKIFLHKITLMSALALTLCSASAMGVTKMSSKAAEGDIAIDETNFPDDTFRNYVLEQIDINDDNILSTEEQFNTSLIEINNKGITNAKGIEYFTNLKTLDLSSNKLTSIDVSKNTELLELNVSFNYDILSIDISNNTQLEEFDCSYNKITSLDLTDNINLETLLCNQNKITNLILPDSSALTWIDCSFNSIAFLDISKYTELRGLRCSCNSIYTLDITKNEKLVTLDCHDCGFTELDLSNNSMLKFLECSGNKFSEGLDVSANTELKTLRLNNSNLFDIDVSNNIKLEELNLYNNNLTYIDVSNNTKIIILGLEYNNLTSLDLSKCTELSCADNFAISNEYDITLNVDNEFDLTTLPGNFDVNKASDWSGGTVNKNILTADDGVTEITYIYDCGMNYSQTFTLTTQAHNYVEVVDDKYLKQEADCINAAVYYKSCSICNIAGTETFTSGDALGHEYKNIKNDETNHWHVCSRCEGTDVKEAHTYGTDSKCTVCGYEKIVDNTEDTTENTTEEPKDDTTTQAPSGSMTDTEASTAVVDTTEAANTDSAVETGDTTNIVAMAGVMMLALFGIVLVAGKLKREKNL